jgi:enterochelin esterase-like enzyme/outer membrane protein assembly factor BamB
MASRRLFPAGATTALAAFIALVLGVGRLQADHGWPGLRGPSFDGSVRDASLFDGDRADLALGWKRALGSGYSTLSVADGRVIAMFAADEVDVVAAFATETGDELWRYTIGDAYKGHDGSHDGPIATPTLAGGKVFGLGTWGHLFALDGATGRPLWTRHLVDDHGATKPHYGFTSSPVVANGVLVVEIGAGEGKSIAGFDTTTGDLLWSLGDDPIAYQSPVVVTLGGQSQVLAASATNLYGIDAATGRVLWQYEHGGDETGMGGETIIPVPAGEGRFLLPNKQDQSVMLEVVRAGDTFEVKELWASNAIRSSYVHPVFHQGYLYGMAGRIFTCVDAATGETQWRSREPGDGFPTLVGDHLVIITKPGTLHVAEASPEGYHELARMDLFEDQSWSAVAYADGKLFARSMGELARIDPSGASGAGGTEASWVASTAFGVFLADVEKAGDKAAMIDTYLAAQSSFPIIEPSGAVHFVYRGEAEDVGIVGDMIGFRREDPMTRVAGTDLFYYSMVLEPTAAVAYGFIPDYGEAIADPRNAQTGRGLFGEVSWFAMPAWEAPAFLHPADAARQGRIETVSWTSEVREGQERSAKVYLPAGYDRDPERRYATVYIPDGQAALDDGVLQNALDNLISAQVEPVIAVFVMPHGDNPRRDLGDANGYAKMLATELVPRVDAAFRTIPERMSRATAGVAGAADIALISAFEHADVFGRVAAQSSTFLDPSAVIALLGDGNALPTVIYHEWGTYHLRSPHEAWDMAESNRVLWQALRDHGYRPVGGEVPDGFGWACWQGRTDDWLAALFPMHRNAKTPRLDAAG